MKENKNILIVGAGAAGLMAAYCLQANGFSTTVLEAGDTIGGRIRTLHKAGYAHPVELGAEFVHGDLPVTQELLTASKLAYEVIAGNIYRVSHNTWSEMEEVVQGWDMLIDRMKQLKQDVPLHDFLLHHFGDPGYAGLRQQAEAFAQSFDVADARKASVKGLLKEWDKEDHPNKKINKGYGQLMEHLAMQCRSMGGVIHTDSIVRQIKWQPGEVILTTLDQQTYAAERVIITVSAAVLSAVHGTASIAFTPDIPAYRQAAAGIGFGNVVKILLFFKEAFWKAAHADAAIMITDEAVPVWWTCLPFDEPMLTGFVGGPPADKFRHKTREQVLSLALTSLSQIFGLNTGQLKDLLSDMLFIDWSEEPFTKGAYSYPMLGTGDAVRVLMTPIESTIYFAGEAIYDGDHPATVEAALASGKRVAEAM